MYNVLTIMMILYLIKYNYLFLYLCANFKSIQVELDALFMCVLGDEVV